MPYPMPMPGQAQPQPQAQPQGAPPMGGAGPLAAIARQATPSAGGGGSAMQLMTFMAGMGAMNFMKFLTDLRTGGAHGGHKSTGQKEAQGNPQQTQINPQMLAQLAMRRQQAMQPNLIPSAGGGGGGMNPLAALMGPRAA